ncbi:MAG: DUF2293 domain-containing protein [Anaerolineae bacterium]|nr:DUF2293 domain-containing protein [Anaerolineae bacterium]
MGIRDNSVVWIKKDGSVSHLEVPEKKTVSFCGFPVPHGVQGGECISIKILMGNPLKDEVIYVEARGHSWWGKYLLSKATGEFTIMRSGEEPIAEELIKDPTRMEGSLEDYVEDCRQGKRDAVDMKSMEKQQGLKVWESRFFDGYWNPDYGEFEHIPQGWCLLPKGDAAVTRRVRKGPYWVLMRKSKRYSIELGTLAPTDTIESVFEELGGEEAAAHRLEAKERGQEKREQQMTDKLRSAIMRCFPHIPEKDLEEIMEISRSGGAVGTAQWLYFSPSGETEEAFELAANLAVRAYVRHNYTDYDRRLSGSFAGDEERNKARRAVSHRVDLVLDKWKG